MNIMILGGSGFLGRHLTKQFCLLGHQVRTISRTPSPSIHPNHLHTDMPLDDVEGISPMLRETGYVIHVAGDTTPGSSQLQPSVEAINNLIPTFRFLEAAQHVKDLSIIYVSSGGAIYDSSHGFLIDESARIAPMSYYGAGKAAMEQFLSAYNKQTNNNVFILRPTNVYGPGQTAKKQFGIIPTLLKAAKSSSEVCIWGDGSSVRDYLYIDDFSQICTEIVARNWTHGTLRQYNVGTGKGYSILDLCDMVESLTGLEIRKKFSPARGVDVPTIVLNCSSAETELNWKSRVSLLEGLKKTWEWYRGC